MTNARGVTLIELLIIVVLLGIITGMAVPRFGSMRLRWKVDSAAQQVVGDLHRARVEAVKRNDMVYLARTGSNTYTIRFLGDHSLPEGVTFTGPDTVKFAAFGPALTGAGTFQFTLGSNSKEVHVNASGFASVQ